MSNLLNSLLSGTGGGGSVGYPSVNTYADLPLVSSHTGEIYAVLTTTGFFPLVKKKGLYISDGSTWKWFSSIPTLSTYDSGRTYSLNELTISSTGVIYKSLQNSNTGKTPSTSPTYWEEYRDAKSIYSDTAFTGTNKLLKTNNTGREVVETGVEIDASNNVDLKDNNILNTGNQTFNTSYSPTGSESKGSSYWDSANNTFTDVLENGVKGQRFKEAFIDGQNDTGSQINNGTPVEYLGSIGNSGNFRITPAIVTSTKPTFYFIGIATENIINGSVGKITTRGKVRGIQTDGANYGETWNDGDIIYVSKDTAGYLTNVMPEAPYPAIAVALVISAHSTNGTLEVRPNFPQRLTELVDVNGTPLDTTGQILVWDNTRQVFDFTYNILASKEPTGFTSPEDVIVTGDGTTRTITLTGTVNAYYNGLKNTDLISGYTSPAHNNDTNAYFLVYDGTDIKWVSTGSQNFWDILIAITYYDTLNTQRVYQRECHGLMPWQTHKELHEVVGTYKDSGGGLSNYVLSSTTAGDRRPDVEATIIYDEDLPTTNPLLNTNLYTQLYLTSTGIVNFILDQSDVVPLSTNRPYWNEFTGGAWQQTLIDNNDYMSIWLLAIPVASDTISQKYRYIWVQGQSQSSLLSTQRALNPNSLSLGNFNDLTPESVFIQQIIIKYTGGNWTIEEVNSIDGTRFSQSSSSAGNYLTSVSTDATLTGNGTTGNPLSIDTTNANTWSNQVIYADNNTIYNLEHGSEVDAPVAGTGITHGHINDTTQTIYGVKTLNSFAITPSSAPTTDYQVANKKYVDDNAGGDSHPTIVKAHYIGDATESNQTISSGSTDYTKWDTDVKQSNGTITDITAGATTFTLASGSGVWSVECGASINNIVGGGGAIIGLYDSSNNLISSTSFYLNYSSTSFSMGELNTIIDTSGGAKTIKLRVNNFNATSFNIVNTLTYLNFTKIGY